jgi:hypothetical protein
MIKWKKEAVWKEATKLEARVSNVMVRLCLLYSFQNERALALPLTLPLTDWNIGWKPVGFLKISKIGGDLFYQFIKNRSVKLKKIKI